MLCTPQQAALASALEQWCWFGRRAALKFLPDSATVGSNCCQSDV